MFYRSSDLICGHGCQIWRKTFCLFPKKGRYFALDVMGEGILKHGDLERFHCMNLGFKIPQLVHVTSLPVF